MIYVTMDSKPDATKCWICSSYVIPPRIKLEDNPIYAGDYCKNPKSPYFMRKPSGRCDCFLLGESDA